MKFFGIGRGARAVGRVRSRRAETEEEMRERHAREMQDAGFASDDAPPAPAPPQQPPANEDDDDDGDMNAQLGDEMPPPNDPDPDAPPPEPVPAEEDDDGDDDAEDREDEDIDGEPDENMRRARRRAARRRRRTKARRAERARCAAIFAAPAAARNPDLAGVLAFTTSLRSSNAVMVLNRGAAAGGLAQRMAALGAAPPVAIGSGAGSPGARAPSGVAASWDAAMKKARNW